MVLVAVVVKADAFGRFMIPTNICKELRIKQGTKLLLTATPEGLLIVQKLDVEEIARRLESEIAGKDINFLAKSVRQEVNKKIKREYPDLLT